MTVTNTSGAVLGLDAFDVVTPQATQPVTVGDDDPAVSFAFCVCVCVGVFVFVVWWWGCGSWGDAGVCGSGCC